MTDENNHIYSLAVEDGQLLRFSDLAYLMAKATHPEEGKAFAAAQITFRNALERAVGDCSLNVRDPTNLSCLKQPDDEALQSSVLIPSVDLRGFLNTLGVELRLTPYGNGPDYWTLENAAADLAKQMRWHDGVRGKFLARLQQAATIGELATLDPQDGLTNPPNTKTHTYYELVTSEAMNEWLDRLKSPYRWEPQTKLHPPQEMSGGGGLDCTRLATRQQLVDAFGSTTGMHISWFKNLGDTPKLKSARVIAGRGGKGHIEEPFFDPYLVMLWLLDKKRKKGRPISEKTAYRLLESYFPVVYDSVSIGFNTPTDWTG